SAVASKEPYDFAGRRNLIDQRNRNLRAKSTRRARCSVCSYTEECRPRSLTIRFGGADGENRLRASPGVGEACRAVAVRGGRGREGERGRFHPSPARHLGSGKVRKVTSEADRKIARNRCDLRIKSRVLPEPGARAKPIWPVRDREASHQHRNRGG